MKKIRIEEAVYKYKSSEYEALKGVSFDVQKGEFVAILGSNGSGKSTVSKLMNALLIPDSGYVYIDDLSSAEYENIWKIRQNVGMVFQNPDNQIVATIVEEDVAFGPENMGYAKEDIRSRVDFAIERVGMSSFKDKSPNKLSGGQKQRVAIAGVLAIKPSCIIFDEPTSMLDPVGRTEVLDTIKSLVAEGITVVLITHFMSEALLADRLIIMESGNIIKMGNPKEIFCDIDLIESAGLEAPLNIKIAQLLNKRNVDIDIIYRDNKELVEKLCLLK